MASRRSFNIDGAILTWSGKRDPNEKEIAAFRELIAKARSGDFKDPKTQTDEKHN